MIYALNTKDVSDHERRIIARSIRDKKPFPSELGEKVVRVCDTKVGDNRYHCIYCQGRVHKWYKKNRVSFHHGEGVGRGCIGSDKGLSGIENTRNIATTCPESE